VIEVVSVILHESRKCYLFKKGETTNEDQIDKWVNKDNPCYICDGTDNRAECRGLLVILTSPKKADSWRTFEGL